MLPKTYCDVWVKVVEAKDLKAADSNGLSDPYVTLTRTSAEGKKLGDLKTPVVKKNLNPQWYSEFAFQAFVEPVVEEVKLRVFDWSRIAGDKLIGQATLKFEFPPNELQEFWVRLDTKGAVRLLVLRSEPNPFPDYPTSILHRCLPTFHVQLERNHYCSGDVIRGALVLNLAKPTKKPYQLSIRVEAASSSGIRPPNIESLYDSHYFMDYEVKNITVPGTKPGAPCPAGFHIIPFEVALPPTLAPTFSEQGFLSYGNHFHLTASFNVDGKDLMKGGAFIDIHPYPLISAPRYSTPNPDLHYPDGNPYSEPKCISTMFGPMQVVAGQAVTYRCTITNWTDRPIDYLEMRFFPKICGYARDSNGKWHSEARLRTYFELELVDGPGPDGMALQPPRGFPVAANGGQWEGDITVELPGDPDIFSVLPHVSPLVNRAYYLEMRPKARRNDESEPAPRSETKELSEEECAPGPMFVEVFPAPSQYYTPNPYRDTFDGGGPIYLYLEPFQGAQIADFHRLSRPLSATNYAHYLSTDLSPLFQRALLPSPSAKNTRFPKSRAESKPIPEEEWTPGNLPSWLM